MKGARVWAGLALAALASMSTEGHEENMNCAGLGVVSQEAAAIIVGFL